MLIFRSSEMLCYGKGTTEYLTCSIPLIARIRPMKFETLSALPSVTNISAQLSPPCRIFPLRRGCFVLFIVCFPVCSKVFIPCEAPTKVIFALYFSCNFYLANPRCIERISSSIFTFHWGVILPPLCLCVRVGNFKTIFAAICFR
jgi:hypothetical protein